MFRFLPEQASTFAGDVDWLHNLVTDLSVFFTVAIVGSMLWFAFKYRRRDGADHATPRILGDHRLEVIWTVVPTIICIYIGFYGIKVYGVMKNAPADAMVINVVGKQWQWDFKYPNGKSTVNEFVVPVDRPVRLVLTATDVLHSFFIPSMRVKTDAVPGQYTSLWFQAVKTGEYDVFCTEYCGTAHSAMLAKLKVVSRAEYDRWLNDDSAALRLSRMKPADVGASLYVQHACKGCHTLDGTRLVGPSFLKIFGKTEKMTDGTQITVDENYLKESILNPNAKIVEGYTANLMPAFQGVLSDTDVDNLIAFIREAQEPVAPAAPTPDPNAKPESEMTPVERGEKYYKEKICVTCHSLDGSKVVGPSFKGLYGHEGKLTDGSSYTANDEYIKRSILKPADQIVEGYQPAMPSFEGQLNDQQIADIIEFLKTVK